MCQTHDPSLSLPISHHHKPPALAEPSTHPGDDLCFALLTPLSHLGIDLLSDF